MKPMIPKAEATCFRPCERYLFEEFLLPTSSMIRVSLISVSVYSPPTSSTPREKLGPVGGWRESLSSRQLVPSLVEPTTYSHWGSENTHHKRHDMKVHTDLLVHSFHKLPVQPGQHCLLASIVYWPALFTGQHCLLASIVYWPALFTGQHCLLASIVYL